MPERNGAFGWTEAVREALSFLEAKGYDSGDVHDNLAAALSELEDTAVVMSYGSVDVLNVADDIGLELTEEQAEQFCRKWFEGTPSAFQARVYDHVRNELEDALKEYDGARSNGDEP